MVIYRIFDNIIMLCLRRVLKLYSMNLREMGKSVKRE